MVCASHILRILPQYSLCISRTYNVNYTHSNSLRLDAQFFTAAGVLLWGFALWAVLTPGVFAHDSMMSLFEGRTGEFVSNQPPMLGYIWNLLNGIGNGASLLILISVLGFVFGSYLISRQIFTDLIAAVLVILTSIFPPIFTQLGIINKETIACNLILLTFGIFISFPRIKWKFPSAVVGAFLLSLAMLIRYQYIIVISVLFGSLFLIFAITDKEKRSRYYWGWLSTCLACFALFSIALIALVNFTANVNWRAPFDLNWRLQLEYDLASQMADGRAPMRADLRKQLAVDPLFLASVARAEYSPSTNITLRHFSTLLKNTPTAKISDVVSRLEASNPNELFYHHARMYATFLGLGQVCWPIQKQIPQPKPGSQDADLAAAVHLQSFSQSIASRTIFQSKWLPANTFLFRPISYLALSALALMILYSRSPGRRRFPWLAGLPASAFVYTVLFAPIVPSCDFRYSYWLLISSVILATITVFDWVAFALGWRVTASGTTRDSSNPQ